MSYLYFSCFYFLVVAILLSSGSIQYEPITNARRLDTVNDAVSNLRSNDSCFHKDERRFNQNPSIKNVYLRHVFRRYSAYHARATRDQEELKKDLMRMSEEGGSGAQHRYLYLELSASGLGNRLNVMLSGFMWALLTNRILLIRAPEFDVNELLCQPFTGGNWMWPATLSFNDIRSIKGRIHTIMGANRDLETLLIEESESEYQWNVTELQHRSTILLGAAADHSININNHNSNSVVGGILLPANKYRDNKQIIRYADGEMYSIPLFYLSPRWRPLLDLLFPGRNIGHVLATYLLHPRDDVWDMIVGTMKEIKPQPDVFTIGIQGRAGVNTELECLHTKEFRKYLKLNTSIHVFIASLKRGQEVVKEILPDAEITQKFAEGGEKHDIKQVKTALHDIWVLSMTDDAILSRSSTFGYHAMNLKGSPALYPLRESSDDSECHNTFRNLTGMKCYRAFSAEPCFDRSIFFGTHMQDLIAEDIIVRCEEGCGYMGADKKDPRGWKLNVLV